MNHKGKSVTKSESAEAPFVNLTPDAVMDAIESVGPRCDGRLMALNSFENRVYQLGVEGDGADDRFLIAKFYRPGRWTDAAMPWRDAGIAAFSVAGQVLQARKKLENWPLWVGVNAVAVASYWKAELAFTAFLYAVYLGLAVAGWRAWRRAEGAQA